MPKFAKAGSQRWLQICVDRKPQLLQSALVSAGALEHGEGIEWASPRAEDSFREFRDGAALRRAGMTPAQRPLSDFWPARGPVWDGIARTTGQAAVWVEAKAHIAEAASSGTAASPASKKRIESALKEARRYYAPKSRADWTGLFYQYANRLAHQYFLAKVNGLRSRLVFLYFLNADDVGGPTSKAEWTGASRLIHAALGVPKDLRRYGVFDAFVDVRLLENAV